MDAGATSRRRDSHGFVFSCQQHFGGQRAGQPEHHQHRPEQGADPAVERLPHQHVGRRRGRPCGRQRLPIDAGGPQPGHPQRQRRPVDAADQGRRARQHPRCSTVWRRWRRSRRRPAHRRPHQAEQRVPGRPRGNRRAKSTVAGLGASQGFSVFVSNERRRQRRRRRHDRRGRHDHARHQRVNVDTAADAATAVAADRHGRHHPRPVQGRSVSLENRLQFAIGLAQSQVVNTKAAESRIRDANVAEESANLTRYNILNQSGIAALAQANQRARPSCRCSGSRARRRRPRGAPHLAGGLPRRPFSLMLRRSVRGDRQSLARRSDGILATGH